LTILLFYYITQLPVIVHQCQLSVHCPAKVTKSRTCHCHRGFRCLLCDLHSSMSVIAGSSCLQQKEVVRIWWFWIAWEPELTTG